jgi:hypothetical protein
MFDMIIGIVGIVVGIVNTVTTIIAITIDAKKNRQQESNRPDQR